MSNYYLVWLITLGIGGISIGLLLVLTVWAARGYKQGYSRPDGGTEGGGDEKATL